VKGFPNGMQHFMKQYNQLQTKIKKLQEDLQLREFSATSGGGAVMVTVKDKKIETIKIAKDVFESADCELLQDLVKVATNEALTQCHLTTDQEMEKLTGKMSLPGIF